jgi:hypothetical protein
VMGTKQLFARLVAGSLQMLGRADEVRKEQSYGSRVRHILLRRTGAG